MPEILRVLDERYSKEKPASPEVQKFLAENPNPKWDVSLDFVLDTFSYKLWRLTGSAALALHFPGEIEPQDLDLFTDNEEFPENFGCPPKAIDVKTTTFTLELMGVNPTKENRRYLMDTVVTKKHRGKRVLVSTINVIAYSKSYPEPRPKDIPHLEIIKAKVPSVKIDRVGRKLVAA